jgi:3-hydroxy-3-methylglutaryl CoA synthase
MEGIIGYGASIPRNRIKVEEIAKVWGADAPSYKKGLLVEEKSVPSPDQDTITMSVEASKSALKRAGINPKEIGAVYIGSESHPYAVKPSGTVLAEAIGATPEVHTADLEFACKAGTEGMFIAWGRFTGDPAYFKHIIGAAKGIMGKSGLKPTDFQYVIFHQPNGKFPLRVGEILGFAKKQIEPGWLVNKLGNTYSGSSPLGLTATLDISKPGDLVLIVSYGSGAGSDAFILKVTDRINEVRELAPKTRELLNKNRIYLEYGTYAKFRHKIRKAE